jgi:uncharacterized membrane protein YdjX (TVP38/TMEM64 family)
MLVVAALFALVTLSGSLSAERVRDRVDEAGVLAPVAFVLVSAALTVCLFPGPLLAGAAGLLFGTWAGFPLSLCAAVLGACAAFGIARSVAGEAVAGVGGPRVLALCDAIGRRGFVAVLYARIVPGVPYSLVNYAAGLAPVRLAAFAGATALGAAPRAFAYTALGGSLGDWSSPEAVAAVVVLVLMAAGAAVSVTRGRRRREAPPAG